MRRALLLVLLLACKSNNNATPPAPSASVASTPSASVAPPAENPAHAEARRVVQAWSDALDKHDLVALEKTYGDPVVFYKLGPKPKKTVLAMKRSVLGPKSTFHQQIMDRIEIAPAPKDTWQATFTKRSGNGTKLGDTQAFLVLGGSPLVIVEERDAPRQATSCEEVASSVAWEVPAVKKAMDGVRKELPKYPDRNEGGIGPETFEDGTIQASIGVHSPERFERIASFTVYPNGRLDVNVGGEDYTTDPSGQTMDGGPAKKLPEADRKRVTAACSHGHTDEHGEGAGHGH